MPRPRPAPGRTPAAPPRRRRPMSGARGGRRCGDGQRCRRRAAADRGGHPYQQRHAHTDRDRGGRTAERETAGGRPAHRSGESQRVLDETQGEYGQPGGDQHRCQPSPSGWPSTGAKAKRYQYSTASATDTTSTRRGRSRASATMPECGRIPAKVRRSRRRSPAWYPAWATARRFPDTGWPRSIGCRPAGSGPARPILRSRQPVAIVGATVRP